MADSWAHQEFAGCQVPDNRFVSSVVSIASNLARNSEVSFSQAVGHGGRQSANRMFRNKKTNTDGLLAGHYEQTAARCAQHDLVLLAQDTTFVNLSTHKSTTGLGPVGTTAGLLGLVAHSVLAVSTEGQPLGLLDVDIFARDPKSEESPNTKRTRSADQKESRKWADGLKSAQSRLPVAQHALVVCDREADVFSFLATPRRKNIDLLVRACQPRIVEVVSDDGTCRTDLRTAAGQAPQVATMQVVVPSKPGRAERVAELTLRSTRLLAHPPVSGKREPDSRPINLTVIEALETNAEGVTCPIHWILITTKELTTATDYCQMVTYYSKRWVIERLHYTLKSGCRVERLQIDDAEAFKNALSVYYVVAWRLMWLTYIARTEPDRPAAEVLEATEIAVLEAVTEKPIRTVALAVLAIAALGGYEYYKAAPPPGPKTLWLGIRKLDNMVLGWNLARRPKDASQD